MGLPSARTSASSPSGLSATASRFTLASLLRPTSSSSSEGQHLSSGCSEVSLLSERYSSDRRGSSSGMPRSDSSWFSATQRMSMDAATSRSPLRLASLLSFSASSASCAQRPSPLMAVILLLFRFSSLSAVQPCSPSIAWMRLLEASSTCSPDILPSPASSCSLLCARRSVVSCFRCATPSMCSIRLPQRSSVCSAVSCSSPFTSARRLS
mmetsp:Transcript_11714/g.29988  ORF Transcript_11714/g.29988 Transcript_11714/m.29988 type:complete len:210 (-) Transcript_11714:33-662(-)